MMLGADDKVAYTVEDDERVTEVYSHQVMELPDRKDEASPRYTYADEKDGSCGSGSGILCLTAPGDGSSIESEVCVVC